VWGAIQKIMTERNAEVEADRRMQFGFDVMACRGLNPQEDTGSEAYNHESEEQRHSRRYEEREKPR
jgi:hypothetical protein